ncbi:MAG: flagellar biosynthetic protein FliO [bacterium]
MRRCSFYLLFAMLWASPAWAESPPPPLPELNYGALFLRLTLVLAGVCVLAWVSLRWGLKRYQPATTGPVKVRARVPVEPRRSILLIEIGEKVFVVASTEHGMTNLGTLAAADVPQTTDVSAVRFSDALARLRPSNLQPMEDEP